MNTEFPTRVPVIQNSTDTTTSKKKTSSNSIETKSEFEKTLLTIFRTSVKTLQDICDFVSSLPDRFNRRSNNKPEKVESHTNNEITTELREIRKTNKKDSLETRHVQVSFFSSITKLLKRMEEGWETSIESLQRTVENTNGRIGAAIGNVFGSGIIGQTIGNVITKSLNYIVSKILIGTLLKNIPLMLKIAGIGAAIAGFLKSMDWAGDKIAKGIDYIVAWLRQKWDKFTSWLPWNKGSKYDEARSGLAEAFGVDESEVVKQYGDTVKGRDRMLKAWKQMSSSQAYKDKFSTKSDTKGVKDLAPNELLDRLKDGSLFKPTSVVNQSVVNNYNNSPEDSYINPEMSYIEGEPNYSPIVNNITSTNSVVSQLPAENVASMYPSNSINDGWGGYSPIPANFY